MKPCVYGFVGRGRNTARGGEVDECGGAMGKLDWAGRA